MAVVCKQIMIYWQESCGCSLGHTKINTNFFFLKTLKGTSYSVQWCLKRLSKSEFVTYRLADQSQKCNMPRMTYMYKSKYHSIVQYLNPIWRQKSINTMGSVNHGRGSIFHWSWISFQIVILNRYVTIAMVYQSP